MTRRPPPAAVGTVNANADEDVYVVTRRPGGEWSAPTRLTTTGAGMPRWSPDGRFISAISRQRGALIIPSDGGPERLLIAPHPEHGNVMSSEWARDAASDESDVWATDIGPRP